MIYYAHVFYLKYVPAVENSIADYLSHLLNPECLAPDYPILLRTFKADQGLVKIIHNPEVVDYELL